MKKKILIKEIYFFIQWIIIFILLFQFKKLLKINLSSFSLFNFQFILFIIKILWITKILLSTSPYIYPVLNFKSFETNTLKTLNYSLISTTIIPWTFIMLEHSTLNHHPIPRRNSINSAKFPYRISLQKYHHSSTATFSIPLARDIIHR